MISGYFISSICKAFFHICDLDVSSVPTNFGLGFCIEFTDTNFGSIIFYYIFCIQFQWREFLGAYFASKFWGNIICF